MINIIQMQQDCLPSTAQFDMLYSVLCIDRKALTSSDVEGSVELLEHVSHAIRCRCHFIVHVVQQTTHNA